MNERPVALITGANKGIGREIARQLGARGFTVLVGSRDSARGEEAAAGLRAEGLDARAVALDVTRAETIAAARDQIQRDLGRLDVLVNNAGIVRSGGKPSDTPIDQIRAGGRPSEAPLDQIREVFETNVFGVIAVTQAMLPLLRAAPAARIVNVSSGAGSIANASNPAAPHRDVGGVAYGPSKSALNHVTVAFANELEGTPIKVNAACPGYTATDLNGHTGPRTVEQGAREPVRLATLPADGPTGTFSNENGPIPW